MILIYERCVVCAAKFRWGVQEDLRRPIPMTELSTVTAASTPMAFPVQPRSSAPMSTGHRGAMCAPRAAAMTAVQGVVVRDDGLPLVVLFVITLLVLVLLP